MKLPAGRKEIVINTADKIMEYIFANTIDHHQFVELLKNRGQLM